MDSNQPSEIGAVTTFFRKYGTLFIVLVVTVGVLIGALWFQLPHMVAAAISKKLEVPVTIRRVSVSWNKISFYDLWIENPEGYSLPFAFQAATVEMKAPLSTYFRSTVHIEEILLRDIYLGFEFLSIKGPKGNWSVIMSNLEAPNQSPLPKRLKREAKVSIDRLLCIDIETDVYYRDRDSGVIELSSIEEMEFTNITSDEGIPSKQIMDSVLVKMLNGVFTKQNLANMLGGVVNLPAKGFKLLFAPFAIFGNSKDDEPFIETPFEELLKEQ